MMELRTIDYPSAVPRGQWQVTLAWFFLMKSWQLVYHLTKKSTIEIEFQGLKFNFVICVRRFWLNFILLNLGNIEVVNRVWTRSIKYA